MHKVRTPLKLELTNSKLILEGTCVPQMTDVVTGKDPGRLFL
jgi:hypothetical protein